MMARSAAAVCAVLCNLCGGLEICAFWAVGLFLIKRLIFARKPSHLLRGKQTFKELCRRNISMEGVPLILYGFDTMLFRLEFDDLTSLMYAPHVLQLVYSWTTFSVLSLASSGDTSFERLSTGP
jgi:hypothetical protein